MLTIFALALLTALATGLGALPLLWGRKIQPAWGEAFAAGLMLAASGLLIYEGWALSAGLALVGGAVGAVFVEISWRWLHKHEETLNIGELRHADARRALLIVGVMTAHSFAEGVGIGVAFADGTQLGLLIALAMAIHNIPEGLAIALVLVPRGVSVRSAAAWSVFSSLPQPLVAVPAYLLAVQFAPLLPLGLGFAAGAMIWLCFREMLPEAQSDIGVGKTLMLAGAGLVLMGTLMILL
jgi:zinc transporter ZupT